MRNKIIQLLFRIKCWCLRRITADMYSGIRICDINHDKTDDSAFVNYTREALLLIEKKDPKRFNRVRQEISFIVNKELTSGGQYRHATKCCFVDFGRYHFDRHAEWYLLLYAGMIVHEATHGILYSKGFMYTQENRKQIERICHAEKSRFLSRAKPEWRKHLVNEFDPARWHFSWTASRWARARILVKRMQESAKKPTIIAKQHVIGA